MAKLPETKTNPAPGRRPGRPVTPMVRLLRLKLVNSYDAGETMLIPKKHFTVSALRQQARKLNMGLEVEELRKSYRIRAVPKRRYSR